MCEHVIFGDTKERKISMLMPTTAPSMIILLQGTILLYLISYFLFTKRCSYLRFSFCCICIDDKKLISSLNILCVFVVHDLLMIETTQLL